MHFPLFPGTLATPTLQSSAVMQWNTIGSHARGIQNNMEEWTQIFFQGYEVWAFKASVSTKLLAPILATFQGFFITFFALCSYRSRKKNTVLLVPFITVNRNKIGKAWEEGYTKLESFVYVPSVQCFKSFGMREFKHILSSHLKNNNVP